MYPLGSPPSLDIGLTLIDGGGSGSRGWAAEPHPTIWIVCEVRAAEEMHCANRGVRLVYIHRAQASHLHREMPSSSSFNIVVHFSESRGLNGETS
jgi:hypothetical protein